MDINFQFEPFTIKRTRKKLVGSLSAIRQLDVLGIIERNNIDTLEDILPQLQVASINQQLYQQCDELTIQKYLLLINIAIQYFQHTQELQNDLIKDLKKQEKDLNEQELNQRFKVKHRKAKLKDLEIENELYSLALEKEKFTQDKKKKFSCYFCPDKFFDLEQLLDNHIQQIHEKEIPHPPNVEKALLEQQAQLVQNEINQIILQNQQLMGFYLNQ